MGIFGSAINFTTDASVSEVFSHNKGLYLNITHIYFGLGALTAPIVFNFIFSKTSDFRSIYLILFFITLFTLILISLAKYPSTNNREIKFAIIGKILSKRNFIFLCILFAFTVGTQLTVSSWIPTLFQKILNISQKLSNYSLSFFWIAVVIGRVITTYMSKKLKEIKLIKIQLILLFSILAISFFLKSYILLLIDYNIIFFKKLYLTTNRLLTFGIYNRRIYTTNSSL